WKFSEALPEIPTTFDDSSDAWVLADHTSTPNPTKPRALPVLYADDCGFYTGVQLFRGKFNEADATTGASLTMQGGTAFAPYIYLNGQFLDAFPGDVSS
ncbi:galactose-binding domain-like protein, partial [Pterulicium gracile]